MLIHEAFPLVHHCEQHVHHIHELLFLLTSMAKEYVPLLFGAVTSLHSLQQQEFMLVYLQFLEYHNNTKSECAHVMHSKVQEVHYHYSLKQKGNVEAGRRGIDIDCRQMALQHQETLHIIYCAANAFPATTHIKGHWASLPCCTIYLKAYSRTHRGSRASMPTCVSLRDTALKYPSTSGQKGWLPT